MWMHASPRMVDVRAALRGRDHYQFAVPSHHFVLGTPLHQPYPAGVEWLGVGMGCFWGAERRMWQLPGIYTTAAGYQGGYTPHPTYEEVCSGRTGHAETVLVAYNQQIVPIWEVLRVFWENHDPTTGYQQGNDIGTQYRSTLFWNTPLQRDAILASVAVYAPKLEAAGFDPITTEIAPARDLPFYFAEAYHQQFLAKNPHGYDCHANTGIALGDRP